jgi:hypothetical protein
MKANSNPFLTTKLRWDGRVGRHSRGPASGFVRLELCCVKGFWLLFAPQKVTKGKNCYQDQKGEMLA